MLWRIMYYTIAVSNKIKYNTNKLNIILALLKAKIMWVFLFATYACNWYKLYKK